MKEYEYELAIDHFKNTENCYEKLGKVINQHIDDYIVTEKILSFGTYQRIKDLKSLEEKIKRKQYTNPIEQIEDFCGLRVICYYSKDIDIISDYICSQYKVVSKEDKTSNLDFDKIGYRSKHFVVTIKEEWRQTNNQYYNNIMGLKAEIQVRTVLMHCWAELEHKFGYKSTIDVPAILRRKIHLLSALFEIGDNHIQEIAEQRQKYIDEITQKLEQNKNTSIDFDSLEVFLKLTQPNRKENPGHTRLLLEEIIQFDISFTTLRYLNDCFKSIIKDYESSQNREFSRAGVYRIYLDYYHEEYWTKRKEFLQTITDYPRRIEIRESWISKFRSKLT